MIWKWRENIFSVTDSVIRQFISSAIQPLSLDIYTENETCTRSEQTKNQFFMLAQFLN